MNALHEDVRAMAGLDRSTPIPTEIEIRSQSKVIDIAFNNGKKFSLSFEFLRVHSPSAEVQGHGPGQEVLQVGKRNVGIKEVEPVGMYAIKPHFDDGHDTGIFSWDYLYKIGDHHDALWADYLARLDKAGVGRD
jgi:DUF971 family protein